DHNRVFHGAGVFQNLYHLGNGTALLADRVIDANQVVALVVNDGVEDYGSLAGLAIADDQLALASAYGDHGVDRLQSGGHRLAHGLAGNDSWGDALDRDEFVGGDGTFVVDGLA